MGPAAVLPSSATCKIPALLDTLAAAYAEVGNFATAVNTTEEALKLAGSSDDADAVKLSENLLESFRKNLPYREEPTEE